MYIRFRYNDAKWSRKLFLSLDRTRVVVNEINISVNTSRVTL